LAALFTTLGIAIIGGIFSGWVASNFGRPTHHLFEDVENFYEVPVDKALHKNCPDSDHQLKVQRLPTEQESPSKLN